jgi:hypothetical protein
MGMLLPKRICSLSGWKKESRLIAKLQNTDLLLKKIAVWKWSRRVSTRIEIAKILVNMNPNRSP